MGSGSIKKRPNKPRNLKPQPSMASSRRKASSYATVSVLLLVFVTIGVIGLLVISSIKWRSFRNGVSYETVNVLNEFPHDPISSIKWRSFRNEVSYETVNVINEFPHDPDAFTQGLLYAGNDTLFESTGLYGKSSLRKVALHTGKVELLQKMDSFLFGEGLTLLGERLFQVTWLQKTGFVYHRNNLSELEKFTHEMKDGWGLTTDGEVLFGTDGSSTLYRIDPQTFKVISKQVIYYKEHEVHNLNELEFINGEVWANVFMTDCIAKISPEGGGVLGWILLPKLREELLAGGNKGIDVLNGIAWDSEQKRIFVTGKLWPKLYEIKVVPINKPLEEALIERLCLRMPFKFSNS